MERWSVWCLTLGAVLILALPTARAEESGDEPADDSGDAAETDPPPEPVPGDKEAATTEPADEETVEELEAASKEAMEEAQRMLERAKERRGGEGPDSNEPAPARGAHTHWPEDLPGAAEEAQAETDAGDGSFEEVEPIPVLEETKRERKIRIRAERRALKAQRREEKRRQKLELREERARRKAMTREERRQAKEEARARKLAARGEETRPRFYINGMISGALLTEDDGNRITDRDHESLEGVGALFRVGGVIKGHHLIGARFQTFLHLTSAILERDGGSDNMGSIFQFYGGPEYRYITSFNLYFGVSPGISVISIDADLNDTSEYRDRGRWDDGYYYEEALSDDRGVVSIGLIGMIGYELRFSKWFMMNFELYLGYFNGLDDDEYTVNSFTAGLGVGLGF